MERGGRQTFAELSRLHRALVICKTTMGRAGNPFFSRRSDSNDEDSDFNAQWRISAGSVN